MIQETGDRRHYTGGGRHQTGEGFSDVLYEKFSTYDLAGEFVKIVRTLIANNRKYKLAIAAKSTKWGKQNLSSFPLNEKFSGQVPDYGPIYQSAGSKKGIRINNTKVFNGSIYFFIFEIVFRLTEKTSVADPYL